MKNEIEQKVETLTKDLAKRCGGQGAAVVIGAGLNLIMTAAQQVPDKHVRAGMAMSFRSIADQLDAMSKPGASNDFCRHCGHGVVTPAGFMHDPACPNDPSKHN
jgi:hypothetical protein